MLQILFHFKTMKNLMRRASGKKFEIHHHEDIFASSSPPMLTLSTKTLISMKLPRASIPLLLVQLLLLNTISFAFLSTTFLPILARSHRLSRFPGPPIASSAKGHTSISSWSKIAESDAGSSSFHLIDAKNIHDGRNESLSYNLASPREWLEYCEAIQPQQEEENGSPSNLDVERCGGAYTVLRCDFLLDENSWRIWGEDYHMNRLRQSYRSLLHQRRFGRGEHQEIETDEPTRKNEQLALDSSLQAMNLLLEEAKKEILRRTSRNESHSTEKGGKSIIIVMLTLLWDLDQTDFQLKDNDKIDIRVRGHTFSTMKVSQLYDESNTNVPNDAVGSGGPNPNAPLQAVIGHLPTTVIDRITQHEKYSRNGSGPTVLPNRYQNFPRAKLSSWCRRRRLLEDIFKTNDIGDVILTKHCDDEDTENSQDPPLSSISEGSMSRTPKLSVELLEGLTTNLFVVYPGKILRTAPSTHVLGGYVRHLIIQCAENCGYKVEFGSISVEDSSLWEEVFLTSSIRLIMPVNRIFLPHPNTGKDDDEPFQLKTLWELPSNEDKDCHRYPLTTASDVLYTELVKLSEKGGPRKN